MPSLLIRGDALPLFQRIRSARWTHYLVQGDYVPLRAKLPINPSMLSRDPTLPVSVDPSLPSLYRPGLLVKAGTHGNQEDVILVGARLAAFVDLFSGGLDPPLTRIEEVLGG